MIKNINEENLNTIEEDNTLIESEEANISESKVEDKTEDIFSYKGKWYVINCYSGQEERVRDDLVQRIESMNMKDVVFDIRVVKGLDTSKPGKKPVEKNLYPGYIFINMIMNDDAWYIVRNTTGVTGFIGSSGRGTKPFPLTEAEAREMLTKAVASSKNKAPKKAKKLYVADFKENDFVKIKEGAFANMEGQVTKLDYSKGIATINIEIFGRLTPTEFSFSQCEKVN